MNGPLYGIEHLAMVYGERTVLDLTDMDLEKGKVVALLGPNGAGKTTLLEILAFLLRPTRGVIRFQGKKVDYDTPGMIFLRRRVALVPQDPILFTTSVFKNVAFPLKIRKVPKSDRQRVVDDLLSLVDMRPFREAKAHRLSGGETQRLAIARALACSPEVILLDEPTSSVDVENQITIERIIKEINREKGISVIFTSHDLLQASRLAHETVYLFKGRAADYTYENIFSGRIETRPDGTPYCRLNDTVRLPIQTERRGPVKISIHPDKVSVQEPGQGAEGGALQGRLIQLSDSPGGIRALVDVGVPVSVILSRAAFDRAPLRIGQTVWLSFPAGCIEIF